MPTYKIEYHRVWITTIEAESRKQARQIAQDEMGEKPEREDYSYSVVKKKRPDRDSGGEGHNGVWGSSMIYDH